MKTLSSLFAAPAFLLAATTAVAAEPSKTFTHDGITYVYDATPDDDGAIVLTGRAITTGARFRLVVRDGRVKGIIDSRPVAFSVASSRGAADGATSTPRAIRVAIAD